MPNFAFPPAAVPDEIPHRVPLQILSLSAQPPDGEGWLHEIKHDGPPLLAIVTGSELRFISRNGHDRSHLFCAPIATRRPADRFLRRPVTSPLRSRAPLRLQLVLTTARLAYFLTPEQKT